jgi:hypothetical protein
MARLSFVGLRGYAVIPTQLSILSECRTSQSAESTLYPRHHKADPGSSIQSLLDLVPGAKP